MDKLFADSAIKCAAVNKIMTEDGGLLIIGDLWSPSPARGMLAKFSYSQSLQWTKKACSLLLTYLHKANPH